MRTRNHADERVLENSPARELSCSQREEVDLCNGADEEDREKPLNEYTEADSIHRIEGEYGKLRGILDSLDEVKTRLIKLQKSANAVSS